MRFVLLTVLWTFFSGCLLFGQSNPVGTNTDAYRQSTPPAGIARIPTFTEEELVNRVKSMHPAVVTPRFDNVVRSYINTYTVRNRSRTEAMLGRSAIYFPLFEKYLEESGLPSELKFLSVVESALNPTAVSRSGAVGLWQFMPATGKDYGLKISSWEDQRRDPHLATAAALKYLKRLYNRFGSWELALAAYNGGPGRVNRAIRRGRSKNFWTIRKYLPRETRNYVPAFIAATYIMHYYQTHNLYPKYPAKELQATDRTMVYRKISFREIANITGIREQTVATLNPSYLRRTIPARLNGCSLILPVAAVAIFNNFLGRPDQRNSGMVSSSIPAPTAREFHSDYVRTSYSVKSGDHLESLAHNFGCTEKDIVEWNRLTSARLSINQRLIFYLLKKDSKHLLTPVPAIPKKQLRLIKEKTVALKTKAIEPVSFTPRNRQFARPKKKEKYVFYQVRRRETLAEIASKFPGVSPQDLIKINGFKDGQSLKPGKRIKIKTK